MRQGSDCGDQYARLNTFYINDQKAIISGRVNTTVAMVWVSMGVYFFEVSLAIIVLFVALCGSCSGHCLSCGDWASEFGDVFKYMKVFN